MAMLPTQDGIGGPAITPRTQTAAGQGGQQMPPYLQMRRPIGQGFGGQPGSQQMSFGNWNRQAMPNQTQPVVTPKASAPGDTVNPQNPPQAGGSSLGDVYNFFKSDLANQRNQALANTRADASARGVFYGTPLTGSEADINTQYLRGLGQLQSGMYGNEQQNQLARLGMASNLMWQNSLNQPNAPAPMDWSQLGSIFGLNPGTSGSRTGPMITPNTSGNTTPGQQGQPVQGNPMYKPPWMQGTVY